jgi:hypothetical protein
MSNVTQREQVEATMTEPLIDGGYQERTYRGFAWRCDGCGLVWEKRHQAQGCEGRNHQGRYEAGPYGGYVENGRHVGGRYYPRAALRREVVPHSSLVGGQLVPNLPAAPRRPWVGPAKPTREQAVNAVVAQAPASVTTAEIQARLARPSATAARVQAFAGNRPTARLAGPARPATDEEWWAHLTSA